MLQKTKQLPNCLKGAETSVILVVFWWCPLWSSRLYCYRFFPLLNMNQVPEKLSQWPNI